MDMAFQLRAVTLLEVIFFCLSEGLSIPASSDFCDEELHCNNHEYCCHFPDYHCCDYVAKSMDGNSTRDGYGEFSKTGLRSALALLILSSGMFLICFCVMKCRKRHSTRPIDHGSTLAAYRRRHARTFNPLSWHQSSHRQRTINLTVHTSSRTEVTDEPPSYNEVISTDASCNRPTEKPPEYSSLIS